MLHKGSSAKIKKGGFPLLYMKKLCVFLFSLLVASVPVFTWAAADSAGVRLKFTVVHGSVEPGTGGAVSDFGGLSGNALCWWFWVLVILFLILLFLLISLIILLRKRRAKKKHPRREIA